MQSGKFNLNEFITETASTPVCDFCRRPGVLWRYPATDFIIPEVRLRVKGDWAACGKCADYIESDKLDDLAFLISGLLAQQDDRAQNLAGSDQDALHHLHYYWMRRLYREFTAHRQGSRISA
jgi:hypothetical protein